METRKDDGQIPFPLYQTPMAGKEARNEGGRQIRMINERDEGDGGRMREDQRRGIRESYDKRGSGGSCIYSA